MPYYFSKESQSGTHESWGFGNDIIVLCWADKKSRDNYVAQNPNLSCEAINKKNVIRWATNFSMYENRSIVPKKFTTECWVINKLDEKQYPGYVGYIDIVDMDNIDTDLTKYYERFHGKRGV